MKELNEIGGIALTVRSLFVDSPRGPSLLGRADFLDRCALTVDQRRRRIVLDDSV